MRRMPRLALSSLSILALMDQELTKHLSASSQLSTTAQKIEGRILAQQILCILVHFTENFASPTKP